MTVTTTMQEHPGWVIVGDLRARAFRCTSGRLRAVVTTLDGDPTLRTDCNHVPRVVARPQAVTAFPVALNAQLLQLGTVLRWQTVDPWEAVVTAIIRQVIRAGQARKLYRAFSEAHGPSIEIGGHQLHAIPDAEVVAALSVEQFAACGLRFKAEPLRNAAAAHTERSREWAAMSPFELWEDLQRIRRVGEWTAGAAVADLHHEWALYPFADIAVRKWATTAAPDFDWPTSESSFAALWREMTGDRLGELTVSTLAWGVKHGGTT